MKWLQLSDLHIKDAAIWEQMKKSYTKIISEESINFVVVTGDLHNYGEDYTETKSFFDQIIKDAKIEKTSLFVVPGNHDSQNFDNKNSLINDINENLKSPEYYRKIENQLLKSFYNYEKFLKEYFDNTYDFKHVEIKNWKNKINIICLNTALISNEDKEQKLIIDINALSKLNINNNLPTIAIGHHNLSGLFEKHYQLSSKIFTDLNVIIYLCGHEHKDFVSYINKADNITEPILSITCMKSARNDGDGFFNNGFIIYTLDSKDIGIKYYNWSERYNEFVLSSSKNDKFKLNSHKKKSSNDRNIHDNSFKISGYSIFRDKTFTYNGIKYFWRKNDKLVESIVFNNKWVSTDGVTPSVSGYTSSLSHGCILNASNEQCIFCKTGYNPFKGYLTAEEVALQNIFMVEHDRNCKDNEEFKSNSREFSYMGQGEAGYVYSLIRKSILLTDCAMKNMEQEISKYIISTCGITDFIPQLIKDVDSHIYTKNVSLHFSLNAIGPNRDILMPINKSYNYEKFIKECSNFFDLTRNKISVSIILFNDFKDEGLGFEYSLSKLEINKILDRLDNEKFKINLRGYNSKDENGQNIDDQKAKELRDHISTRDFEVKLSNDYNVDGIGFGQLDSSGEVGNLGNTIKKSYKESVIILDNALKQIEG